MQVLLTLRRSISKFLAPHGFDVSKPMVVPVPTAPARAQISRVAISSTPPQTVADDHSAPVPAQHSPCQERAEAHSHGKSGKAEHRAKAAPTDGFASEAEHSDRASSSKPKWGDEAEEAIVLTATNADIVSASEDSDIRPSDEKSRRQHRKKTAGTLASTMTDTVPRPRTWGQGGVPLLQKKEKGRN